MVLLSPPDVEAARAELRGALQQLRTDNTAARFRQFMRRGERGGMAMVTWLPGTDPDHPVATRAPRWPHWYEGRNLCPASAFSAGWWGTFRIRTRRTVDPQSVMVDEGGRVVLTFQARNGEPQCGISDGSVDLSDPGRVRTLAIRPLLMEKSGETVRVRAIVPRHDGLLLCGDSESCLRIDSSVATEVDPSETRWVGDWDLLNPDQLAQIVRLIQGSSQFEIRHFGPAPGGFWYALPDGTIWLWNRAKSERSQVHLDDSSPLRMSLTSLNAKAGFDGLFLWSQNAVVFLRGPDCTRAVSVVQNLFFPYVVVGPLVACIAGEFFWHPALGALPILGLPEHRSAAFAMPDGGWLFGADIDLQLHSGWRESAATTIGRVTNRVDRIATCAEGYVLTDDGGTVSLVERSGKLTQWHLRNMKPRAVVSGQDGVLLSLPDGSVARVYRQPRDGQLAVHRELELGNVVKMWVDLYGVIWLVEQDEFGRVTLRYRA